MVSFNLKVLILPVFGFLSLVQAQIDHSSHKVYISDTSTIQLNSASSPNFTLSYYTKNNYGVMEFHAMLMLDMYNVQGWTADRGLWSAIGFMQNNNQTFYDGVHCKLSSVTFNSTKDIQNPKTPQ